MKKLLLAAALLLALFVAPSAQAIKIPSGFHKKVYNATMALSATSKEGGVTKPKFLCTVTAFEKVKGGYLLVGAGHCTSINGELPSDLVYYVSDDLDKPTHPVYLLRSVLDDTQAEDLAIYYYPTRAKYPVIALGNEGDLHVGDKTVDVNFSLKIAKMVSPGVVASVIIQSGEVKGFFVVDEFASHGASGSSVVDEKTHMIVGLLIAGWDGATVGNAIEPISTIKKELATMNIDEYIRMVNTARLPREI